MTTETPASHESRSADRTDAQDQSGWQILVRILRKGTIVWVLLLLMVIAHIATPDFLTVDNLLNVTRQTALIGILGVGMTFVILTAGIDLSVGSVVSVVSVVSATLLLGGYPIPLVLFGGLAVGAVLGALNGLGVTLARVPPFIMTLGMLTAGQGLALTFSNGQPVGAGQAASSLEWLNSGSMLGISTPIWVFVVVAILAAFVLRRTTFGRRVYAVGDNAEAARLSGINVSRTVFSVYVIAGALAGLTGLIYLARLTVGEPTAGQLLELDAIAIVVIGGTALFGGQGGIGGTVVGAAIVSVLSNLLNLLGVSPFTQDIVKGAIIVAAVVLERIQHRRRG
ncbi:ABC transporter permease [Saccharopolyspora hattusasensis]|uniref:ABC transporter permease n=1 Tax=Saccharopolyspora hattusasensis TaxID=1128679 RepID=UPI003D99C1F0